MKTLSKFKSICLLFFVAVLFSACSDSNPIIPTAPSLDASDEMNVGTRPQLRILFQVFDQSGSQYYGGGDTLVYFMQHDFPKENTVGTFNLPEFVRLKIKCKWDAIDGCSFKVRRDYVTNPAIIDKDISTAGTFDLDTVIQTTQGTSGHRYISHYINTYKKNVR